MEFDDYFIQLITVLRRISQFHRIRSVEVQISSLNIPSYALEKEMATHSSVLAWRIPGTEEPSGLPSMGSHRVGHD